MAKRDGEFQVGDRVQKISGYQFVGDVRGVLTTRDGRQRVVVEHDDGWLFIFALDDLAHVERAVTPRSYEYRLLLQMEGEPRRDSTEYASGWREALAELRRRMES